MARSRAYRKRKYKRRVRKQNAEKAAARRALLQKPFRAATLRRLGIENPEPLLDIPRIELISRFNLSIHH